MNDLYRQDDDADDDEIQEEASFQDMETHQEISTYYEQLEHASPRDKEKYVNKMIKLMVKRFYDYNEEPYSDKDRRDFFLGKDKNLYIRLKNGNEVQLSKYDKKGVLKFYKFNTLQRKYGKGGFNFIRNVLNV